MCRQPDRKRSTGEIPWCGSQSVTIRWHHSSITGKANAKLQFLYRQARHFELHTDPLVPALIQSHVHALRMRRKLHVSKTVKTQPIYRMQTTRRLACVRSMVTKVQLNHVNIVHHSESAPNYLEHHRTRKLVTFRLWYISQKLKLWDYLLLTALQ